jgi:hypothetical protein
MSILDNMPRIRFLRPWRVYKVGQEISCPGTIAQFLTMHRYAERINQPVRTAEAPLPDDARTADAPAVAPRKRGRPRKVQS